MKDTKVYHVYVYFRPTGIPCYVGKGYGDRWKTHLRRTHNLHLSRIIAKAGRDIPVVVVRDDLTNEQACEIEMALIKAIGRGKSGPLVNLTDGGEGMSGYIHSESAKEKIRASNTGRTLTPEQRAKVSAARSGSKSSPETCEKIRASHVGKPLTGERLEKFVEGNRRRGIALRGTTLSDEAKAKVKAACNDPEVRARWLASYSGFRHSEESKARMRATRSTPEYRAASSAAHMGHVASDEARAKMSAVRTGLKRSEESKANIRNAVQANWDLRSQDPTASPMGFQGKHHSEETKAKMREAALRYRLQKLKDNAA
jgi:hypothetical protein